MSELMHEVDVSFLIVGIGAAFAGWSFRIAFEGFRANRHRQQNEPNYHIQITGSHLADQATIDHALQEHQKAIVRELNNRDMRRLGL